MKLCEKATNLVEIAKLLSEKHDDIAKSTSNIVLFLFAIRGCAESLVEIQKEFINGINDLLDEINNNDE